MRPTHFPEWTRSTPSARFRIGSTATLAVLLVAGPLSSGAHAAAVVVPLETASSFSVLAGSTVTNTGATTVDRNVGVSPGTAITGAETMTVGGTYHQANAVALQAKDDLTTAFNNAAGQTPRIAQDPELGGETLFGGVYNRPAAMGLNGVLTLDGQNDPDSVWVFQAGTTLITGSASSVVLINGANPCNVFWQVGSSATLGTGSSHVGTIMADQTITMNTGAKLQGRALARIGAVNLQSNVITSPRCPTNDVTVGAGTETPTDTEDDDGDDSSGGANGGGDDGGANGGGDDGGANGGADDGGANGGANDGGANGGGRDQIATPPTGGVDTGQVSTTGPFGGPNPMIAGVAMVAGVAGLAVLAERRRRRS